MKTLLLYLATAIAEIVGCYLPLLWLRGQGSGWLLMPAAALSLATFAWLLTLHAAPSGRVYAAYGGVYVAVALAWLWSVDGIRPSNWDWLGVAITLLGMAVIAFQPKAWSSSGCIRVRSQTGMNVPRGSSTVGPRR